MSKKPKKITRKVQAGQSQTKTPLGGKSDNKTDNRLIQQPKIKQLFSIFFRYTTAFLPSLLWAILIFWFSQQSQLPGLSTPLSDFILKKTAHFLIYAGLYFWLWWGLAKVDLISPKSKWFIWTMVLGYAISDEWHQSFVVTRTPHIRDIVIDCLGATTAVVLLNRHASWPKWLRWLSDWLIPKYKLQKM